MQVSEWADRRRFLPRSVTNKPGKWRTDRVPYTKEIMDCMSANSIIQTTVVMKGAQTAISTTFENAMGYSIDQAQGPMMYLTATKKMAQQAMQIKFEPLIEHSGLSKHIKRGGDDLDRFSHKTGSTKDMKMFHDGFLLSVGANSPGDLRSNSIKYLYMDEVDGYTKSSGHEGCPLELARTRTDSFEDSRKEAIYSTPLIEGLSAIEDAYLKGDQRKYFVPCKDCGHYQTLDFFPKEKLVNGKKKKMGGLVWEVDDDRELKRDSVRYCCEECGCLWKNEDKILFLGKGEWRATNPECKDPTYRSYHVPALIAGIGLISWTKIVEYFLSSKHNPQKLKTFWNNRLGLPFKDALQNIKVQIIEANRGMYKEGGKEGPQVPKEVDFLVASADVHKKHIEFEVLGYAKNKVCYSILWKHILTDGDTINLDDPAWDELRGLIRATYGKLGINQVFIDSGDGVTQKTVYEFCDEFPHSVMPISGTSSPNVFNYVVKDRKDNSADSVIHIKVDHYKDQFLVDSRRVAKAGHKLPYGYCVFPSDRDDDYFKEFANENKAQIFVGGVKQGYKWTRRQGMPNESLDCRVYNMAAGDYLYHQRSAEIGEKLTWDEFCDSMKV